jgi:hypothetical protein
MLEELTVSPIPEALLALGGVTAILIGIRGSKTSFGKLLNLVGFIIGGVMILSGVRTLFLGGPLTQVATMLIILGVGLFFRIFAKVPVAIIFSLLLATIAFISLSFIVPNLTYVAIGAGVVFLLSLFIVGSIEVVADTIGRILGWRPIIFVLGVIALLIAGGFIL